MALFLALLVAMSVRIGFMDSYIHNKRKFIGEESINVFVYTIGTSYYISLALKELGGDNNNFKLVPILLIFFLYLFFYIYHMSLGKLKKQEREKLLFM